MHISFPKDLLYAGYAAPYAFLCLYADAEFGTLAAHVLSLIILIMLASLLRRRIALLLAGNMLSFFSSSFCLSLIQDERWAWYFKPFSAFGFMALLSIVLLALQLLAVIPLRRRS